jgi:chromosome segregation ATPase
LECEKRELIDELQKSRTKTSNLEHSVDRLNDELDDLRKAMTKASQINQDSAAFDAQLKIDKKALEERLQKLELQLRKYEASRQVYKKKILSLETSLMTKNEAIGILETRITSLIQENNEMTTFMEKHSNEAAFILRTLSEATSALKARHDDDTAHGLLRDNNNLEPLKESDLAETGKSDLFEESNAEFRKSVDEVFPKHNISFR